MSISNDGLQKVLQKSTNFIAIFRYNDLLYNRRSRARRYKLHHKYATVISCNAIIHCEISFRLTIDFCFPFLSSVYLFSNISKTFTQFSSAFKLCYFRVKQFQYLYNCLIILFSSYNLITCHVYETTIRFYDKINELLQL
jgi:hypothetical protein